MEKLGGADPRAIGGYPLFARLGAGGMGQVYLACTPSGRPLALKTVRSEYGDEPSFGERFAREIRSADLVRSPWTAVVVDHSPAGPGPQWLATEYVAAPSLAEWVAARGPLPQDGLTALAAELCEGLAAVHRAGLAHRDVKPSNVLLPRTRPLLIDFGIARAADDSRHTRTGGVIGSPGYMAPEQATAGVSDASGDVFALGAVLVYAATGRGPFHRPGEEASTPSLLYRVVYEDPDLAGVPAALLPFLRACLAKDPRQRPAAREAAALLPGTADREPPAGVRSAWADHLPPGLEAELAAREARTAQALRQGAALPGDLSATGSGAGSMTSSVTPSGASSVAAPASGTGPAWAPSPYAPATAGAAPAYGHPAYRPAPGGGATGPVRAPGPAPAGPGSSAPGGPGRAGVVAAVVAAGAVVLVLAVLLVHNLASSNRQNHAGGDGSSPSGGKDDSGSADRDALPASWVGTWKGVGPGDPEGTGSGYRTDRFAVTLTLHAGRRGEVVGQQVSDVHDVATGGNDGCTETLRLTAIDGNTAEFTAKTARRTAASGRGECLAGNRYQVTMSGGRLRLGAGSQAAGSPVAFTRQ